MELERETIRKWTEEEVLCNIRKNGRLPARVQLLAGDIERFSTSDWYECRLENKHDSNDMTLRRNVLQKLPAESIWSRDSLLCEQVKESVAEHLERRQKILVNRCVNGAIKSVMARAQNRFFHSAKGKLERVLTEMYRKPPRPKSPPPPMMGSGLRQTGVSPPSGMIGAWRVGRARVKIIDQSPPRVKFNASSEDSAEHPMACILPYRTFSAPSSEAG